MADIKCNPVPGMGKFAFYPLSKKGANWFEEMKGAIPSREEPYMDNKEAAAALTRKMIMDGLVINDAADTKGFKEGFGIKETKPVNINDVVVDAVPVPDKLDLGDVIWLHGKQVCWDRPTDFPAHWVEGRNRNV